MGANMDDDIADEEQIQFIQAFAGKIIKFLLIFLSFFNVLIIAGPTEAYRFFEEHRKLNVSRLT